MALPELVVLDLDECVWSPEMYTLTSVPNQPVRGPLLSAGHGVVGASNSHATVRLFPGALKVLQELYTGLYPGVRVAVASSADNAKAVDCARACLKLLEVFPGVTAWEVLGKGHPAGTDGHLQIGRSPPLSANKTGHFRELKKHTGIPYDRMLFFDDCNWSDNCAVVRDGCKGVVAVTTPQGLTYELWKAGLSTYSAAHT